MQERELIKIASDNPAHPHGYFIQFKDRMKPGDIEYQEGAAPDPVKPPTKKVRK